MATNYGGYMGKVMLIDLSTGQIQEYPWSDRERRLFLGGKTMAAKILGDCLSPAPKKAAHRQMASPRLKPNSAPPVIEIR